MKRSYAPLELVDKLNVLEDLRERLIAGPVVKCGCPTCKSKTPACYYQVTRRKQFYESLVPMFEAIIREVS